MTKTKEEWRAVPGYYGLYEVSSEGRVKSLARTRMDGQKIKEKILKANTSKIYPRVNLSKDGEKCMVYIHRLVAKAFLGDYSQDGLEVAHNNGVADDNRLENLRWATSKENKADKIKHGTHGHKLAAIDVKIARYLRSEGETLQAIADRLGICTSHAHRITTGFNWSHI